MEVNTWLAYVKRVAYPLASLPLTIYYALSTVCLLADTSIFPDSLGNDVGVLLILLLSSVVASVASVGLELRWSGMSLRAWWKDQKLWVVIGTSISLAALFQGIFGACTAIYVGFLTDRTKPADEEEPAHAADQRAAWQPRRCDSQGIIRHGAVDHEYDSWGPLGGCCSARGWSRTCKGTFVGGVPRIVSRCGIKCKTRS